MDFLSDGALTGAQFFGVLVLIALAVLGLYFYLRRTGPPGFAGGLRSKGPRLQIVETLPFHGPGRRTLLLVRRDGVEHLILVGGPNDLVVEQTIIRGLPMGTVPSLARSGTSSGVASPASQGSPAHASQSAPAQTASLSSSAGFSTQDYAAQNATQQAYSAAPSASDLQPLPAASLASGPVPSGPVAAGLSLGAATSYPRVSSFAPPVAPPVAHPAPSPALPAYGQNSSVDDLAMRLEEELLQEVENSSGYAEAQPPQVPPAGDIPVPQTRSISAPLRGPAAGLSAQFQQTAPAQQPVQAQQPASASVDASRGSSSSWLRNRLGATDQDRKAPAKAAGRAPAVLESDRQAFDRMVARITENGAPEPPSPETAPPETAPPETAPPVIAPPVIAPPETASPVSAPAITAHIAAAPATNLASGTQDEMSRILDELSGQPQKPQQ